MQSISCLETSDKTQSSYLTAEQLQASPGSEPCARQRWSLFPDLWGHRGKVPTGPPGASLARPWRVDPVPTSPSWRNAGIAPGRDCAFSPPSLTPKQPIPINPASPKTSSSCMNYPRSLPSLISFPQWIKQMAQSRGSGLLTKCLIRRTTLMWPFSSTQDDWTVARQHHESGLLSSARATVESMGQQSKLNVKTSTLQYVYVTVQRNSVCLRVL